MGLLDQVLGGLMGGGSGGASPIQGVLMSLLGGGQQGGSGQMGQTGMGNQGMGSSGIGGGGLAGLVSGFEQAGLGHIVQSWVGNGPNQSVSPQQLQSVFGQNQVQSMSDQAGMAPHDFLSQLSQHLPSAVNGMTPNGQLPDEDRCRSDGGDPTEPAFDQRRCHDIPETGSVRCRGSACRACGPMPARADNQMGYRLLSQQEAAGLPHNQGSVGLNVERSQQINDDGMTFEIIRVTQVRPNSAGARAGLKSGDQIIALDGRVFPSLIAFADYIGSAQPGSQMTVDFMPAGGGPQQAQRTAMIVDVRDSRRLRPGPGGTGGTGFDRDVHRGENRHRCGRGSVTWLL